MEIIVIKVKALTLSMLHIAREHMLLAHPNDSALTERQQRGSGSMAGYRSTGHGKRCFDGTAWMFER